MPFSSSASSTLTPANSKTSRNKTPPQTAPPHHDGHGHAVRGGERLRDAADAPFPRLRARARARHLPEAAVHGCGCDRWVAHLCCARHCLPDNNASDHGYDVSRGSSPRTQARTACSDHVVEPRDRCSHPLYSQSPHRGRRDCLCHPRMPPLPLGRLRRRSS